jgi:hypothetical protein
LGGACAVSGCSESKARQSNKKLRDQIELAQKAMQESRNLIEDRSRVPQETPETARKRGDAATLDALGRWVKQVPGRENILVVEWEFDQNLARWRMCRQLMAQIKDAKATGAPTGEENLLKLREIRKGDLLPIPPDDIDKITATEWREEQAKERVLSRLESFQGAAQAEARRKFFGPLFQDMAQAALESWIGGKSDGQEMLTAPDERAEKMLADWVANRVTLDEILSSVGSGPDVAAGSALRELVEARLRDANAAKVILAGLRGGQPVALSQPLQVEPEALELLKKAHQGLAVAMQETGDADPEARKIAQTLLGQIMEQQGEYHGILLGSAGGQLLEAVDLAMAAVHEIGMKLDAQDKYADSAPAKSGDSVEDGRVAVAATKSTIKTHENELAGLQREQEAMVAKADRLSVEAGKAYVDSRTADAQEVREQRLDEFTRLQKEADDAAYNAGSLRESIRAKNLDLKVAQVNLAEQEAKLALVEAAAENRKAASALIDKERRLLAAELARLRKRLEGLVVLVSAAHAKADKAGTEAGLVFGKAAGEFSKTGPEGLAPATMMLVKQADVIGRQLQLQAPTAELAKAAAAELGRPGADPDGATQKFFDDKIKPYMLNVEKLRTDAETRLAEAANACEQALPSARPEARSALKDVLAASYLAHLRIASDRDKVAAAAKRSSLGDFLVAAPLAYDPSEPMEAVRKLRAQLGLPEAAAWKPTTRPAVPATQPAERPGEKEQPGKPAEEPETKAAEQGAEKTGAEEPDKGVREGDSNPAQDTSKPPAEGAGNPAGQEPAEGGAVEGDSP